MRRLARRLAAALACLIALYLIAGTVGGMIPTARTPPMSSGQVTEVLLLPGPIHTDILIPLTTETRHGFADLAADGLPVDHPDAAWLVVGWGARAFYTRTRTWQDLRPGPVWRAVAGDAAVMRIDVLGGLPKDHGLRRLVLNPAQLRILLDRVAQDRGAVLPVPGYGATDRFYAAAGRFSALRTCNVWVGEVLREAGVPVGLWTPFTWSLPS